MVSELTFGTWLRRRRRALDLTREEVAQRVSCSVSAVRRMEADELRPSKQLAEALAATLGIASSDRSTFVRFARDTPGADTIHLPIPTVSLQHSAPRFIVRSTLPAQPTPLIGREQECAAVGHLLRQAGIRLVTLTGPGGTGKTRLALQVAAELLDNPTPPLPTSYGDVAEVQQRERGPGGDGHFPDGVWFVNLAPIGNPGLVATTIARALGVAEVASRPVEESLHTFLRAKRTLLLLDNFEQILDAAPLIAELLAAVPGLKLLVTSRAILHVYGEHEFAVPPLALPPPIKVTESTEVGGVAKNASLEFSVSLVAELTQYEAVRLFIARAQAAKSDFSVTNTNAPALAEICHRLDGLPLAIELAAARIKFFPPKVLLGQLGNRLQVLTGGPRDQPARQQTLRNTIDWSYDLLSPDEQALFRQLGVFVGRCGLEAAEAVCIVNGDQPLDVVNSIVSLTDKSLLRHVEGTDEPRFVMLETIREYALERLAASDELAATQRRHAEYYLALTEAAEPALKGHSQGAWLARLEGELDNLRAALDWGLEHKTAEATARIGAALKLFWSLRDHVPEGIERLEAALAQPDELPPAVRAKALAVTGQLLWRWDSLFYEQHARELCAESLARYRALDDQHGIASVLVDLGFAAVNLGDARSGTPLLEESLALFRTLDDKYGMAWALLWLGIAAHDQRDHPASKMCLTESLAHARAVGDQWCAAWALSYLAFNAHTRGDYAAARALHEERLMIEQALDHKQGISASLMSLGYLAEAQQDYAAAQTRYQETLEALAGNADHANMSTTLLRLGDLAYIQEDYLAARLWYDRALAHALPGGDFSVWALTNLAGVARQQGDNTQAIAYFTESLEMFRGMRLRWGVAYVLRGLGYIAASHGALSEATAYFKESVAQPEEGIDSGYRALAQPEAVPTDLEYRALCLAGLAAVAQAQGQPQQAARLCGAADEILAAPLNLSPLDRIEYNHTVAAIRAQLDEATFSAVWAAGRAMTLEQAIAYTLSEGAGSANLLRTDHLTKAT